LNTAIASKLGEISYPSASHPETKTVDGMERGGSVTSETRGIQASARTPDARCVLSSRLPSISAFSRGRRVGGGSGLGSTLRRLRQSLSVQRIVIEHPPNVAISPDRSNDYSYNDSITSGWKALLLNKVVVGKGMKLTKDDTTLTQPPPGYDSVSIFGLVHSGDIDQGFRCLRKWSPEDL